MHHKAKKIVIITEKLIAGDVARVIESCGATGYTIVEVGGKGSRGVRSSNRSGVAMDTYANVKIEAVTSDALANDIAVKVAEEYFSDYSGIIYLEDVEILRPQKF